MQKKDIINLIKYHTENNDRAFREAAYTIAKEFDDNGDYQLGEYIMAMLSNANTFVPQGISFDSTYFTKVDLNLDPLPLPDVITEDLGSIIRAIDNKLDVNKFLFKGPPGTGKTESAKQIARILNRDLYSVNFNLIIDSRLGQTGKNIEEVFDEINSISDPNSVLILFDEIDTIALDRINYHDVREMGRATSIFLQKLDTIKKDIVLIATTNLFERFDKALSRRFDFIVDFNRYTKEELIDISVELMNYYLSKFKISYRNTRLFKKIINLIDPLLMPGELKNLIKTSIAFSNGSIDGDYLVFLYRKLFPAGLSLVELQDKGFTLREIEVLTGISRSSADRKIKELLSGK